MNDAETMVLASIQVFMVDPNTLKPVAFGSGFTLNYLGRRFFISVSHVADYTGLVTYLETNQPFDPNDGPILKSVGGICYFDLLSFKGLKTIENFEEMLNSGPRKRMDICFAELKEDNIALLQPAMNFGAFQVPYCEKITLDMEHISVPDKSERYGFYGKIRPSYSGRVLTMTPTLKHSLAFHRTSKDFHIFLAPQIIRDKDDFAGCSGAPVLDSQQRLVGVVCEVGVPSKIINVFPIQKCKELLDYAIQTKML